MSIEALKQALEALEGLYLTCDWHTDDGLEANQKASKTIDYLRQVIAEAEKQEPHSWYSAQHDEWMTEKIRKEHERLNSYTHKVGGYDLALYTHPQQRTKVVFPTMLRKMWSGSKVQAWLDENVNKEKNT